MVCRSKDRAEKAREEIVKEAAGAAGVDLRDDLWITKVFLQGFDGLEAFSIGKRDALRMQRRP